MGISLSDGQGVNPTAVETRIAMNGAHADGLITAAAFSWTASPCPAAVKIKFFRPAVANLQPTPPLTFLAERGPFDVTAPLTPPGYGGPSTAKQMVAITPPVEVRFGDLVAITNLTACGGPVYAYWPLLAPPPAGASLVVRGDVTSTVTSGRGDSYIQLTATGPSPALLLISERFAVTLAARDPRTDATAEGLPIALGTVGVAGYFSLPAFTGDPTFPEVTVKMADATHDPSLGGDFWVFHAPLTDTEYTVTVKDQYTGRVRTYSNGSPSPGQLCGGVDTSAFPSE
jgi:hypothetical protein